MFKEKNTKICDDLLSWEGLKPLMRCLTSWKKLGFLEELV